MPAARAATRSGLYRGGTPRARRCTASSSGKNSRAGTAPRARTLSANILNTASWILNALDVGLKNAPSLSRSAPR